MSAAANGNLVLLFCIGLVLLQPLAIAGLALINAGLVRSRNAAHTITSSLCVVSVAILAYFCCGFALQGYPAYATQVLGPDARPVGLFLQGASSPYGFVFVLAGSFGAALASLVPLGASAERWRFWATCASTAIFAGGIYPLLARLVWHPFSAKAIMTSRIGAAVIDAGGSGVIQAAGGLTALSLAWLLGPRHGKYSSSGMPSAIPAHNVVIVLFGCMLTWVGWLGLNTAGALLNAGVSLDKSALISLNTTFCAAAAALTAAAVTRVRFRKPDASLIANGWLAGLVASSAGCASLKPATSILTGMIGGALVVFSVDTLEFRLKIDDPCGSISVHAISGIWGILAAGIFVSSSQFMAQIVLVATLLGMVLPVSYAVNWLLGRLIPHRISVDGERQGTDLHELGAEAYPDFATHSDDFLR